MEITREAVEANVRGVVYGRNVWQADDLARISGSVREVAHGVYARR